MRRKIPGRKHRGIRDPDKQAQERFNKIKDKVNAPPGNPDDQPIPKSLTRIIELKNQVKNGEFGRKKRKKKTGPRFQQLEGESDDHYVYRANKMCATVRRETAFEVKYGVEIKRNEEGEVEEVVKRPKDELVKLLNQKRKEESGKGKKRTKKKTSVDEPKLTKSQKRRLKLAEKKQKKKQLVRDFDDDSFKDKIKFGDQVHAPPTLSLPRNVKTNETPRPGKKTLLLKSLLSGNLDTKSKVIDRKGKRKDLPNALRRNLDKQQAEIIQAYKNIKAQKYLNKQ